jgi:twinfilin-like protein
LPSLLEGLFSPSPETLVQDLTVPVGGPFEDDLGRLQTLNALEETIPAYILARLAPSNWLLVCYVPDSATVRDKVSFIWTGCPSYVASTDIWQMLYASTRGSLTKSLGSTLFTDTIFASSRTDLTPEAYVAHRRHLSAPKPLSAREQEVADVRAAESSGSYNGSHTRANHVGTGVELRWPQEVEEAIKHLTASEECAIVVAVCDTCSVYDLLIGSE